MLVYTYGAITDRGDVRRENQDSIVCLTAALNGNPAALFLIADGMGGLSYGAQVSSFVISSFSCWWEQEFQPMMQAGKDSDEDIKELLEQEIWDINQAVLQFRDEIPCRLGSTLSLLLLYKEKYYIKNIGDSRIYLFRHGNLSCLTEDQSLVAKMVREGRMTEEEARTSKKRNILTMCIGMFQVPESYSAEGIVVDGDQFVLCSDGFYNMLSEKKIMDVLWKDRDTQQKTAEYLRKEIVSGMASDNVSVVLVKAEDTAKDDTEIMD